MTECIFNFIFYIYTVPPIKNSIWSSGNEWKIIPMTSGTPSWSGSELASLYLQYDFALLEVVMNFKGLLFSKMFVYRITVAPSFIRNDSC